MKILARRWNFIFLVLGFFSIFFVAQLGGQIPVSTPNSWSSKIIGNEAAQGTLSLSDGVFHINGPADGTQFVFRKLEGNGQVIVRLTEWPKNFSGEAGVMIRENLTGDARFVSISASGSNILKFERRLEPAQHKVQTVETNQFASRWLKLVREGNAFNGFYSSDGTNWTQISADTVEMGNDVFAGLAVSGSGSCVFDHVQVTSAQLSNPPESSIFVVPTNILLRADVVDFGGRTERVEFFSGAKKIGEATSFPFTLAWSNALAGPQSLLAKIIGNSGAEFFSEPASIEVKMPQAAATFLRVDDSTSGNWIGNYGKEGFCIVEHATNFPAYASVTSSGHKKALLNFSHDSGALQLTNGTGRIVAQLFTYTNMTVNISLLDGYPHQIALYCQDWDSDLRVQQIEVIDPVTRKMLDTQKLSGFHSGKYLVWEIRGAVNFRIQAAAGNAVVSGMFFDAASK